MTKGKDGDGIPQFNLPEENLESNFEKTREKISVFFFFFHGTLSAFSTFWRGKYIHIYIYGFISFSHEGWCLFRIRFVKFGNAGEEEENDSPIEEVRLTVPPTDDPSEPALTFRTWVLGLTSCCLLAFVNQFFGFRQNPLYVSSVSAQILVLPLGKLMAATIPSTSVQIPLTKWSFSLNPGPFTLKEHVLITIFANSGSNSVYALNIVTIVKAFYHRNLHPLAAMLLSQTTQVSSNLLH